MFSLNGINLWATTDYNGFDPMEEILANEEALAYFWHEVATDGKQDLCCFPVAPKNEIDIDAFQEQYDATTAANADQQRDAAISSIFDRFDLNGDGLLDRMELQLMLMEAAAKMHLKIEDSVIDAATDALLEDATGGESQRSVAVSYIVGHYNADDENMKEDLNMDCINKAQFSDIFKRNSDMLRVFMSSEPSCRRTTITTAQERISQDLEQEESENEQIWRATWENWKMPLFWLTLYVAANVIAFTIKAHKYAHHDEAQAVFGQCIIVARGAAQCLNLNCALILLPMARHVITRLRATPARHYFPFDHTLEIHMILGAAILFWTCVHVGAHICDFYNFAHHATEEEIHALVGDKMGRDIPPDAHDRWFVALGSKAGITGVIMVLCMVVAYPVVYYRRKNFNTFWTAHHLLIAMLITMCIHGTDALLEPPDTVWWLMIPLGLYLVPRFLRESYCSQTSVIDAKVKNGGVLCLRLQKPAHWNPVLRSGMYAFIHVPAVSPFEWHPFTLTSSPGDPFLEFHIRNAGDWTNALHQHVRSLADSNEMNDDSVHTELSESIRGVNIPDEPEWSDHRVIASPRTMSGTKPISRGASPPQAIRDMVVKVEGPIGASSQGFKDHPILVLIGAGIGVTPMISVLKDLLSNPGKMQRVFFYWTVRDRHAFEWFSDLMDKVYQEDKAHILQIRHFLTSVKDDDRDIGAVLLHHATRAKHRADGFDLILGQQTHHQVEVGRPKWKDELKSVKQEAEDLRQKSCGLFLCGPDKLAREIASVCLESNGRDPGFHFHFHKETF